MNGRPGTPMSDERFERELQDFLDWQSGELAGAPSAEMMTTRVAGRVRPRGFAPIFERRTAILIATLALLAVAIAAAILANRPSQPPLPPMGNGPIMVAGLAYDPFTGEAGHVPCNCANDASWSADGERVAFMRWVGTVNGIWVADLAAGTERQLVDCTTCGTDGNLSMAADGSQVAYAIDGQVWLVDVASGAQRQVTQLETGREASSPTLSPGWPSRRLRHRGEPGIWAIGIDGSDLAQLSEDDAPSNPQWSPDGRSIAYGHFARRKGPAQGSPTSSGSSTSRPRCATSSGSARSAA